MRLSVVRPIETRKFIAVSRQYLHNEEEAIGGSQESSRIPWACLVCEQYATWASDSTSYACRASGTVNFTFICGV